MSTLEGTLSTLLGLTDLRVKWPTETHELTIEATDVDRTVSVPQCAVHDYHPIAELVGKYGNDPLWNELEEIMARNRELAAVDETP